MSITSQRQKAVDFTMPFMNTGNYEDKNIFDHFYYTKLFKGVGILYKKKAPPPPNLFSFLSPFSIDVWIYTVTAYLATSILMFLQARFDTKSHFVRKNPLKVVCIISF